MAVLVSGRLLRWRLCRLRACLLHLLRLHLCCQQRSFLHQLRPLLWGLLLQHWLQHVWQRVL
jgi:hypothetical protein